MTRRFLPAVVLVLTLLAGCGTSEDLTNPGPNPPGQPPLPPPGSDISLGKTAFQQECASCHNSGDGFDLAYFAYPDSTIIRRALGHVNLTISQQIAAYIRWLNTPQVTRTTPVFQPGGSALVGDVAFATTLFGQDAWPAISPAQLRAINPLDVRVELKLPTWSTEGSNFDWLADAPPPPGIMAYNGNRAADAVAAYHASPTSANLTAAVDALHDADQDLTNPGAPCLFDDASRVDYLTCFEVRRWTASLVAQHMLRSGGTQSAGGTAHELWWAVGEAARRARNAGSVAIANSIANQAAWFYLAWIFEPGLHRSFYLENLLPPRQAVFVALRGQVSRPPGSWEEHRSICDDFFRAVEHAPMTWANGVATFALTYIIERLNSGERPTDGAQRDRAGASIDRGITAVAPKVTAGQLSALQALAAQAKAKL